MLKGKSLPAAPAGWRATREWVTLLGVLAVLLGALGCLASALAIESEPIWGSKPLLSYFALTASLQETMRQEVGLTEQEWLYVEKLAESEFALIRALDLSSGGGLRNKTIPVSAMRLAGDALGYNQHMMQIVHTRQDSLREVLGSATYARLVDWIERRWRVEQQIHGSPSLANGARTYRIYATRYDSGGAYTAALPDKCVKFSNAGNAVCADDGYTAGGNYSVSVGYKKFTTVRVLESGPWNVDDAYWATASDPTPRRMFADLPLGMPEAQAAYFNNYNGGKDQFGRIVSAPYGIDLARQVSIDIGLEPGKNDWIDVTFLWTADWGEATSEDGTSLAPVLDFIIPVEVATALPDGSVVHVVQQGQALLHISKAYQVELEQILELNKLTADAVIWPGDELIVKAAAPSPTASPTAPPTVAATDTPRPTRTVTPSPTPANPTASVTATTPAGNPLNGEGPQAAGLLWIVIVLFGIGGALLLAGNLLRRNAS